jgi:hypothetical protein
MQVRQDLIASSNYEIPDDDSVRQTLQSEIPEPKKPGRPKKSAQVQERQNLVSTEPSLNCENLFFLLFKMIIFINLYTNMPCLVY